MIRWRACAGCGRDGRSALWQPHPTGLPRLTIHPGEAWAVARILVIDDDGFYRGVIRRILEDGGHQVLETEDGREAVDLYRQFNPDVVVTDIFMPGMDGGEVIRALRAVDNHVKIVA